MHKTRNDLPKATRAKIIELLNARLSDALDLAAQLKQAHWNVKGPHFIALHELFDKIAESVEDHVDDLAERAVSLGGTAEGTVQAVHGRTSLKPYPLSISDGRKHLEAVANALASFGKLVRAGIDQAGELKDADTADLFTEISRNIDKQLWFVEAHLESAK